MLFTKKNSRVKEVWDVRRNQLKEAINILTTKVVEQLEALKDQ